ncbi:unnamed protein product [Prunus armeniaca]
MKFWRNYYLARRFMFVVAQVGENFGGKLTLRDEDWLFCRARSYCATVNVLRHASLIKISEKTSNLTPVTFSPHFLSLRQQNPAVNHLSSTHATAARTGPPPPSKPSPVSTVIVASVADFHRFSTPSILSPPATTTDT